MPGRERALVVGEMGLVRRAHLAHERAGKLHDVGDAKRPADLHELAARHDGLAAASELGEHHHDRGRVVVHGDGASRR